jgi:CDP-glucose 4,6-dehydratase
MPSVQSAFQGKRVFITGHTGFKGSWLSVWLLKMGARVYGYSLPPHGENALFTQLRLEKTLESSVYSDLRDAGALNKAVASVQPEYVFHLAAQPLVRQSYADPTGTFSSNVMGTVNLLEALRGLSKPCAAVFITTDKVYENREWLHGYREGDPLGGHDPYSASKAAAEVIISSYRSSFFSPEAVISGRVAPVAIASARAGNVIGGGDWAADRIVPDCARASAMGKTIHLRNPNSTRPWQHVLEPLRGYLELGARMQRALVERSPQLLGLCGAFNFGPNVKSNRSVRELVLEWHKHWPAKMEAKSDTTAPHEAGKLHLSIDKAYHLLGWSPMWDFAETVAYTARWYRESYEQQTSQEAVTLRDIAAYEQASPGHQS